MKLYLLFLILMIPLANALITHSGDIFYSPFYITYNITGGSGFNATNGQYLYNQSNTLYFNETMLNATCDARDDVGTSDITGFNTTGPGLYNISRTVYANASYWQRRLTNCSDSDHYTYGFADDGTPLCAADSEGSDTNYYTTSINCTNATSHVCAVNGTAGFPDFSFAFTDIDSDTDTNCSVDGSCSLITYDSETAAWDKDAASDLVCAGVPACETDAAHDQCSEISGCVVGAITDGNTGWDNSYGFVNNTTTSIMGDLMDGQNFFLTELMHTGPAWADFYGAAISSGTIGSFASETNHHSAITIRDSTTANGGYRIYTDTIGINLTAGTYGCIIFKPRTATNQWIVRLGFHDATTVTAPVDGCFFEMNNNTAIVPICRNNSVQYSNATANIVPNVNNWYKGCINITGTTNGANNADFYLYNSTLGVTDLLGRWNVSGKVPSTANYLGFGAIATQNTTAAAQDLVALDAMWFYYNNTVIR
jgi:hypothetical protein